MSEEAGSKDIYLFEIDNGASGFAEYVHVYRRDPSTTHAKALAEITGPALPKEWLNETEKHAAGDLDMQFAALGEALVFVRLPDQGALTETEFGKDVVIDLPIKGGKPNIIIREAQRYALADGMHRLCSFELDMPGTLATISRPNPAHKIARLPIMFDFVDKSDGMSPVFKDPHRQGHTHDAVGSSAPVLGHGGIHPRGGSSLILLA
jgi:hypothetical protein